MDINIFQYFFAYLAAFAVKNVFAVDSSIQRDFLQIHNG